MPAILFVLHGMGVHGSEWAAPVVEKLNGVAARYAHFESQPLSERVQIHPITYDHVFDHELQRWADAAGELGAFVESEQIRLGPGADVVGWLARAGDEERGFFWSHTVDVLLYRYVDAVARRVRLHVMTEVVRTLTDAMRGGDIVEASVLSHSLGTAVAHDALALLGGYPLDGNVSFTAGRGFRFANLFAVANVSRVLESVPGPYTSVVFPVASGKPNAYLNRYHNFRHRYDPIPAVRPFAPVGWGAGFRETAGLDHVRDFDVHALTHYLDSPRVHVPLLNALLGPKITAEEEREAVGGYPEVAGVGCPPVLAGFRRRSQQIADLVRGSEDPKRLVIAGAQFLALVKEVRDACV